MTGSTCGSRPKRTAWTRCRRPNVTPSTALPSAASMASEKSFPNAPKSEVMMASMPAKGPSPTTLIQMSAQISVSTLRIVSRNRRVTKRKTRLGMTLSRRQEAEQAGRAGRRQQRPEEGDGERLAPATRDRPAASRTCRRTGGTISSTNCRGRPMPLSDADPGEVEDREPADRTGQQHGDRSDHDDAMGIVWSEDVGMARHAGRADPPVAISTHGAAQAATGAFIAAAPGRSGRGACAR